MTIKGYTFPHARWSRRHCPATTVAFGGLYADRVSHQSRQRDRTLAARTDAADDPERWRCSLPIGRAVPMICTNCTTRRSRNTKRCARSAIKAGNIGNDPPAAVYIWVWTRVSPCIAAIFRASPKSWVKFIWRASFAGGQMCRADSGWF